LKAGKMDGMAAQTAQESRTGPGVGAAAASDWTRQSLHERTRVRTDDERIGTGVGQCLVSRDMTTSDPLDRGHERVVDDGCGGLANEVAR
jgi:hypothetical protein